MAIPTRLFFLTISVFSMFSSCWAQANTLTDADTEELTTVYNKMYSGLKSGDFAVIADCTVEESFREYANAMKDCLKAKLEHAGHNRGNLNDPFLSRLLYSEEITNPREFLESFNSYTRSQIGSSKVIGALEQIDNKILSISGKGSTAYIIVERRIADPEALVAPSLFVWPAVKLDEGWRLDIEMPMTAPVRVETKRIKQAKKDYENFLSTNSDAKAWDDPLEAVKAAFAKIDSIENEINTLESKTIPVLLKIAQSPEESSSSKIDSESKERLDKVIDHHLDYRRSLLHNLRAIDESLGNNPDQFSKYHQSIIEQVIDLSEFQDSRYMSPASRYHMEEMAGSRPDDFLHFEEGNAIREKYFELLNTIHSTYNDIELAPVKRYSSNPFSNNLEDYRSKIEQHKKRIVESEAELAAARKITETEIIQANPKLAELNAEIDRVSNKITSLSNSATNNENANLSELQAAIDRKKQLNKQVIDIRGRAIVDAKSQLRSDDESNGKPQPLVSAIQHQTQLEEQIKSSQNVIARYEFLIGKIKASEQLDKERGFTEMDCINALLRLRVLRAKLDYLIYAPLPGSTNE